MMATRLRDTIAVLIVIVSVQICVCTQTTDIEIKCVPLRNCPKLLNLLKVPLISQRTIQLLQTAQCGYERNNPKVWCAQIPEANCMTPEGTSGTCTPIKKCLPFIQLLKSQNGLSAQTMQHLQEFQCIDTNSNSISVCCSENENFDLPTKVDISNTPNILSIDTDDSDEDQQPSLFPKPSKGECGLQLLTKIVGGKITAMDEFPWTALLQYQSGDSVTTACAGTLISNKYVVTAAHCVDNLAIHSVGTLTNVILGEFDTRTETDCINNLGFENCADPPVRIPVEKIIVHPQWYTRPRAEINHDIALLRLAEAVVFTDYIKPICLPASDLIVNEQEYLMVTGWGQTKTGQQSFVKLKTTVPVANKYSCIQKYQEDKKIVVGDGEICAGGEEGKDSCLGDSGGPLMQSINQNGIDVWFLIGVVSFGSAQPCGIKDYPGLYTYLPKYTDWIYTTVQP